MGAIAILIVLQVHELCHRRRAALLNQLLHLIRVDGASLAFYLAMEVALAGRIRLVDGVIDVNMDILRAWSDHVQGILVLDVARFGRHL